MSAFVYPSGPHRRRHGPSGYATLASFRPWLRDEFSFRCVYCLFREQWGRVKAGFALDHFLPVSLHAHLQLTYDNLLYSCAPCNAIKGPAVLPDPTQVLLDDSVVVHPDGRMEGTTRAARRLIRLLGLDAPEEREARLLWMGIIVLAERSDPPLFRRLMGFPEELPNLAQLRPPGGNTRPEGVAASAFARHRTGTLPEIY